MVRRLPLIVVVVSLVAAPVRAQFVVIDPANLVQTTLIAYPTEGTCDEEKTVNLWATLDFGRRVDRYNGTFARSLRPSLVNRLGTVRGLQLSNWREIRKFLSNFSTVRWPRG